MRTKARRRGAQSRQEISASAERRGTKLTGRSANSRKTLLHPTGNRLSGGPSEVLYEWPIECEFTGDSRISQRSANAFSILSLTPEEGVY